MDIHESHINNTMVASMPAPRRAPRLRVLAAVDERRCETSAEAPGGDVKLPATPNCVDPFGVNINMGTT